MARVSLKIPTVVRRGELDSAALKEALDNLRVAVREVDGKVEDLTKRVKQLEKQAAS
jgi:Mrp family chromosome partitioning ATPase